MMEGIKIPDWAKLNSVWVTAHTHTQIVIDATHTQHTHTHLQILTHTYTHIHTLTYKHTHTHNDTHLHTHTDLNTHTHIHTYTRTQTHTQTLTHTYLKTLIFLKINSHSEVYFLRKENFKQWSFWQLKINLPLWMQKDMTLFMEESWFRQWLTRNIYGTVVKTGNDYFEIFSFFSSSVNFYDCFPVNSHVEIQIQKI